MSDLETSVIEMVQQGWNRGGADILQMLSLSQRITTR